MHIFISHSSEDALVAEEICSLIEKNGKKCFIAPRDICSGKEYAEELLNGIDHSETMILVLSKKSNNSPHVLREVERAVSKSIPILVYKLEEVELTKSLEYFLMTHQWIADRKPGDYSQIMEFVYRQNNVLESDTIDEKEPITKKRSHVIFSGIIVLVGFIFIATCIIGIIGKSKNSEVKTVELGEIITFGTYNGEPIDWRVLHISDDKEEAVLIAKDILTMKPYDVAEGGTFNGDGEHDYWGRETNADTDLDLQIMVRGNSDWSQSNIRTWLNSDGEVVKYEDQAPVPLATSEHTNGYHNEAGFLYDFTDEELEAIVETQVVTNGNGLHNGETITTSDKVFLLSKEELQWFDEAKMSLLAIPTDAAVEQDDSNWYDIDKQEFEMDEYYWWLREPVEGTSSKCYMVCNGYTEQTLVEYNVGVEGFGIRPAITVDLKAEVFQ